MSDGGRSVLRGARQASEYTEQCKVAEWLDNRKLLWCHVPNEGLRTKRNGAALKRAGMKSGVPDILVFAPTSGFFGTAIELKKIGGGRPTTTQKAWLCCLVDCFWTAHVCYGAAEAIALLERLYPR